MATPPKTPKTAPAKPAAMSKPAPAAEAKRSVDVRGAHKPAAAKAAAADKPAPEAVVHSREIAAQAVEATKQAVQAAAAEAVAEASEAPRRVADAPVKAMASAPIAKPPKEAEEKMLKGVETFLEFGRDNAILLVSTGNELALGLHKLSLSLIDWSAESCDKSVAATSALFSAKTVEEVIDLSQELARNGLQQILKEGSELGSLSSKLFGETLAALPGRVVANVEKLTARTH